MLLEVPVLPASCQQLIHRTLGIISPPSNLPSDFVQRRTLFHQTLSNDARFVIRLCPTTHTLSSDFVQRRTLFYQNLSSDARFVIRLCPVTHALSSDFVQRRTLYHQTLSDDARFVIRRCPDTRFVVRLRPTTHVLSSNSAPRKNSNPNLSSHQGDFRTELSAHVLLKLPKLVSNLVLP